MALASLVALVVTALRVGRGGLRSPALAAGATLAILLAGCGGAPQVAQLPPPEVSVSDAVERDVADFFETTGHTQAVESVDVRARVSGYLVKINFQAGDEVKPGDLLFEIDPRPYEAQQLQAEGELARWQAARRKAEADLARNERLRPTGAASQKELDAAIAAKATADAEIISARGRLDQAELNVAFAKVTAPVQGRVSKENVTIGNLVEISTLLTTLVSLEPMYVYFDMDERAMLQYRERYRQTHPGAAAPNARDLAVPVDIGLANEEGYPRRGILDFVDNRVDPTTGTLLARAVFENVDRNLSAGLFVRVRLPVGDPSRSLLVSERAIGTDQGAKYLLVVNDKNVVEYRPVKLGPLSDGLRVIREGLRAGERVITDGIQRARPGLTVNPHPVGPQGKPDEPPAAAAKPAS